MNMSWLQTLLSRELTSFCDELSLFPDEERVWAIVPGVSNSAGTLALHVCGNLQHYVGTVLGGTGYVRDRPLEFSARGVPREILTAELRKTMQVIDAVVPGLTQSVLSSEYPEAVGGFRFPTGLFLLHLSGHLAHHLGQAGYLRRVLTGENRSSGALALGALAC